MSGLAVALALVSSLLFALGTVLQQRATMQESGGEPFRTRFLLRLVRKPLWLLAIVCEALGYAGQAAALGLGQVVVVQVLLVSIVVFALPLGVLLTGQRVGRREVLGAAAVVAGLAVFMVVADPSGGRDNATDRAWIVGSAICAAAVVALAVAARGRGAGTKAALLGTASGVLYGLVAAMTKAAVEQLDDGIGEVFVNWHVYGLLVTSLIAFVLFQASLQTGALAPAISTTIVFETVVGVVVGIFMLDEALHTETWGDAVSVAALVVALGGLLALSYAQSAGPRRVTPAAGAVESAP